MKWFNRLNSSASDSDHQAEQARLAQLQEITERFERVFRGSHGYGFLDWDVMNGNMSWDSRFWQGLGYSESDMEHISDSEQFLEYVHPDDKEGLKTVLHGHLRGNGPGEAVFRIRKKRGGYIWTEVRVGSSRDEKGWVNFMSGIVLDVTKLKQTEQALLISEARHARIIQSSNDGIWEWSAESGGFHFSNRCWEHLGYDDHDDVVNHGIDRVQAWRSRMHPADGKVFDRALNSHIRKRGPFDVVYRIRGKDDSWRWIRARGQMTYTAQGKPSRMSGTNMDITALKLAEEHVLNAKNCAEQANKAKSEFLSSMSHELRTPLNAILGFAQLFDLDGNLTADQRANIAEIKRAGEHLLELVGDVLDLSKIEAGKMQFAISPMLPARTVRNCESLLRAQAEGQQVELTVDVNGSENVVIAADEMRLKQVLLNLMSNAIKYNVEHGKVHVKCERCENKTFRIAVSDTGLGISLASQRQLFQPFNRLGAEQSGIEGSGVGLVITKQLVENMQGVIGFESSENVGSTFWVEFPLAEGAVVADQADYIESDEGVCAGSTLPELLLNETKTILYVEDNLSNQRLLTQLLSRYSQLNLVVVGEALRGIYLARTLKPDMIILDINLPDMDGFEAVGVLHQDPATNTIPVIALSANALTYDVAKGKDAGFRHYLTKPINLPQLISVFNELLV